MNEFIQVSVGGLKPLVYSQLWKKYDQLIE